MFKLPVSLIPLGSSYDPKAEATEPSTTKVVDVTEEKAEEEKAEEEKAEEEKAEEEKAEKNTKKKTEEKEEKEEESESAVVAEQTDPAPEEDSTDFVIEIPNNPVELCRTKTLKELKKLCEEEGLPIANLKKQQLAEALTAHYESSSS
jgi:outer membrane biosynthesis protein TonB